ncbi:MAG TPA: hypothetical protein ENI23_04050 [bacterium]|nr:hypothetical protein [bacterium]
MNNPFDDITTERFEELSDIVRRIAEIEDELDSRGLDQLVKEKEDLRKKLKSSMLDTNTKMVYDEESEFEAVLTERSSDIWDMKILEEILTQTQLARYVKRMVDESAIKDGIKNGDLSRPTLEKLGAVEKRAGAKALYIRARKNNE